MVEIKQKDLEEIIDEDDIVELLCLIVEDLPYNDFGYQGLYDLDKENDFNIGISNHEYLHLLLKRFGIYNIKIDKENSKVYMSTENNVIAICVSYDSDYNCYYNETRLDKNKINKVLYYASLVYEDFRK